MVCAGEDGRDVRVYTAQVAGRFGVHRREVVGELRAEVVRVESPGLGLEGDGSHLDVARRRTGFAEGTDDGEPLRIERRRDEDAGTAGQARRHPYRVAGGTAPAVHGKTDEVEVEQLAELAAELEPRLIASVVGRGRGPHG